MKKIHNPELSIIFLRRKNSVCVVGKKWGEGTREGMGGQLPHFFVPRADLISDLQDDSEGDKTEDICSERGTHSPHPDLSFSITPTYL